MAFQIEIIGEKEPVYLDNHEKGEELRKMWILYNKGEANNAVVEINNWTGKISKIGGFRSVPSQRSDKPEKDEIPLTPDQIAKNRLYTKKLLEGYREIRKKSKQVLG